MLTLKPLSGARSTAFGAFTHETALLTLRRPPVTVIPFIEALGSTERMSSALSPYAVAVGKWALSRAAAPATCGVAIDVPLNNA